MMARIRTWELGAVADGRIRGRDVAIDGKVFGAPSISAEQNGPASILVTWSASGGDTYGLEYSTNGGVDWDTLTTTSDTYYTHTGLSFPGSYTYRVRASKDGNFSDWSDSVTETMVDVPAAPGGLSVTAATTSSLTLSWNNVTGESSFKIDESTTGSGGWTEVGSVDADVLTFTRSGLAESVQRYYRVTAYNKAGGGLPSSTVNSWTVPAAPTGLTATVASSTQIDLAWTDVSTGNESYKVERSTNNSTWTEIATGLSATATTYSATGLSTSTLYYFRVRAANAARNSDYSGTASATTSGAPTAAWSLDFSSGSPWANGKDYTYSSTRTAGTYVDSSGYIATNGANLTTYSEDFTQTTPWALSGLASVTANSGTAPDGNNNAFLLTESVGFTTHRIGGSTNLSGLTAASPHTASVYVKKPASGGVDYAHISLFYNSTVNSTCWTIVNLTNGNIETTNNDGHTNVSARTVNVGDGWYRLILTGTPPAGGSVGRIGVGTATQTAINYSVTSGNAKTLLAWGAQVVNGSEPLPYSKTTTASNGIPRLTHNSSGSRLGLLVEEARTNIVTNSADIAAFSFTGATSTANTDTAPDNTTTADKITETSGTNVHAARTGPLTASAQTYTASGFLKNPSSGGRGYGFIGAFATGGGDTAYCAVVNLTNGTFETSFSGGSPSASYTITDVGNGWYRVAITMTAPSGTTSIRWRAGMWRSGAINGAGSNLGQPQYNAPSGSEESILVWGAQLEQGSAASSYIPTTTASVTRSADLAHVLDSSITSWGDPGALVIHFYPPGQAGTLLSTDDASTAQVGIEASSTTAARAFWSSGSTATETLTTGVQKAVHYWNGSTSKFALNGSTPVSGTNNLTIGNADFVTLGAEATDSGGAPSVFSQYANCVIRKVEFYTGTLTDANLQTITT